MLPNLDLVTRGPALWEQVPQPPSEALQPGCTYRSPTTSLFPQWGPLLYQPDCNCGVGATHLVSQPGNPPGIPICTGSSKIARKVAHSRELRCSTTQDNPCGQ